MFIVVSILLILVKLGNLYVTAELCNNIDDYVLVYNHIKGIKKAGSGTMFILLSLNSKNLKQNKLRFVLLRGSASRLAPPSEGGARAAGPVLLHSLQSASIRRGGQTATPAYRGAYTSFNFIT